MALGIRALRHRMSLSIPPARPQDTSGEGVYRTSFFPCMRMCLPDVSDLVATKVYSFMYPYDNRRLFVVLWRVSVVPIYRKLDVMSGTEKKFFSGGIIIEMFFSGGSVCHCLMHNSFCCC